MTERYGDIRLNETIQLIKKRLVWQYKQNRFLTVGQVRDDVLNYPSIKKKGEYAGKAAEMLRLNENSNMMIKDYLSEGYLRKNGVNC